MEAFENSNGTTYLILEEFPEIDYALLYRQTDFLPYMAVWKLSRERHDWQQSHYFQTLDEAREYIREKRAA